jgi:hypothetical protein
VQLIEQGLGLLQIARVEAFGEARIDWIEKIFADVTTDDLRRVQDVVATGKYRADSQATEWVGKAVGAVLGLDISKKPNRHKVKTLIDTWTKNGALKRETRTDPKRRSEHPFIVVGDPV